MVLEAELETKETDCSISQDFSNLCHEANQSKYATFQRREKTANTFSKLLKLADNVMQELNDAVYTRKLLSAADKLVEEEGFPVVKALTLVVSVNKHLDDFDWSKELLEKAVKQLNDFSSLRALSIMSIQYMGPPGKDLAKSYLLNWKQRLSESETRTSYDYTKLAECTYDTLADYEWTRELLVEAEMIGGDCFFWSHMSKIASRMNDIERANNYMKKAINLCTTPAAAAQLINRLFNDRVDKHTVRNIYIKMRTNMKTVREELGWAENIIQLFRDPEWVTQAYDELAPRMTSADDRKLYNFSRYVRLGFKMNILNKNQYHYHD